MGHGENENQDHDENESEDQKRDLDGNDEAPPMKNGIKKFLLY